MENEEEVIVDTTKDTEEETVETPEVETDEETEVETEKPQYTESEKKLFARAKKAEADLKALKAKNQEATKVPSKQTSSPVDVDERILLGNGMSPELVKELKKVAKVLGTGLIEAQTDTIFVAVKEKFEKEQKSKKSSVGASRGSGTVVPKKDFRTPGLSRDEHKKMIENL